MHDLEVPPIPYLSDARLLTRQEHLVHEIADRRRHRQRRGFALGGVGLAASGVAAALVVLLGARNPLCVRGLDGVADNTGTRPGRSRRGRLRSEA